MFSIFTKTPTLEPPHDALDAAVRDALAEIEAIGRETVELHKELVAFESEIASLPIPQDARDFAAGEVAKWAASLRGLTLVAVLKESTNGFHVLVRGLRAVATSAN